LRRRRALIPVPVPVLEGADFGGHRQVLAAALGEDLAGLPIPALDRAPGHALEVFVPFAEVVAVPFPSRLGSS